jgi:diaminohydroxyphosphoribosylaminopyrimidine deaminase/5-amino-6-(5-phosphoribosylamino)uracil reductase
VDPAEVLAELASRKVRSLLLEGGGEALSSFFDARLVDRLLLFQPPRLLGGEKAPQLWAGRGSATLKAAPDVTDLSRFPLGDDEVWEGSVAWPAE